MCDTFFANRLNIDAMVLKGVMDLYILSIFHDGSKMYLLCFYILYTYTFRIVLVLMETNTTTTKRCNFIDILHKK